MGGGGAGRAASRARAAQVAFHFPWGGAASSLPPACLLLVIFLAPNCLIPHVRHGSAARAAAAPGPTVPAGAEGAVGLPLPAAGDPCRGSSRDHEFSDLCSVPFHCSHAMGAGEEAGREWARRWTHLGGGGASANGSDHFAGGACGIGAPFGSRCAKGVSRWATAAAGGPAVDYNWKRDRCHAPAGDGGSIPCPLRAA